MTEAATEFTISNSGSSSGGVSGVSSVSSSSSSGISVNGGSISSGVTSIGSASSNGVTGIGGSTSINTGISYICTCGAAGGIGCGCGLIGGGVTGTPNPNSGGITVTPSQPYIYSPSSTITFSSPPKQKYTVFKLPIKGKLPNKVYVSGRLVTVGILGSDVQAAFTGDKIVFGPGEIDVMQYNDRLTIALDYGDWLYHYNIEKNEYNVIEFEEDSNIIIAKLVSKVEQR